MSASTSRKLRKSARAIDRNKEGTLGPVPPPLPDDPAVRAELRQRLDRGLASALAGVGEDWEVVHASARPAQPAASMKVRYTPEGAERFLLILTDLAALNPLAVERFASLVKRAVTIGPAQETM